MFAAEHGNKELVKILLARGALVDKRDTGNRTARGYATMSGNPAVMELLPEDLPLV